MIPKFFEFYGYNFNDLRFEIVNVEGITKFYSGNISKDKTDMLVVSNFRNLITFNLELWQAIPFFVGDDEENISDIIKQGHIFDTKRLIKQFSKYSHRKVENEIKQEYGELNSRMIKDWTYIRDKDFELSNYAPEELQKVINQVCHTDFSVNDLVEIRDSSKGISSLDKKKINRNKIEINKRAFKNFAD